eukprot:TRINITY_DN2102_c4_g1_i1.p1 TRINITY_DN2102_c4_g1~~TRINITY_DN2102_c4_g1_i1.p1  ORF type:complete len:344 (+),score=85.49 TRINITY_DN2102_c4_g1_i1:174-1205(+)
MTNRARTFVRDLLTLGLSLLCVYLWWVDRQVGCRVADCLCATCSPCKCESCSPVSPCPTCPECGRAESRNTTAEVLSLVDTFPRGLLSPTRPAVYVITDHPTLTYFSLQGEMPAFDLLLGLKGAHRGDGAVVDVGCGYGAFSLYSARLGFKTLAVEPSSKMLASAQRSARLNGVGDLVAFEGSYIFESNTAVRDEAGKIVKSLPIDTVADRVGRIFLLRVDTRGYEGLILRSAAGAIRSGRVEHIVAHFREIPDQVTGHQQLGKRAELGGVLALLTREGLRARLLRSVCSDQMKKHLVFDDATMRATRVEAWHLPEDAMDVLLLTLQSKVLRGAVCPVWFTRA